VFPAVSVSAGVSVSAMTLFAILAVMFARKGGVAVVIVVVMLPPAVAVFLAFMTVRVMFVMVMFVMVVLAIAVFVTAMMPAVVAAAKEIFKVHLRGTPILPRRLLDIAHGGMEANETQFGGLRTCPVGCFRGVLNGPVGRHGLCSTQCLTAGGIRLSESPSQGRRKEL